MASKLNTVFRCEAAGRPNNEDNGCVINLGKKGYLLLVCDGMGGMEAGEVASEIAVNTIKQRFSTNILPSTALSMPEDYISETIIMADAQIKKYGEEHPASRGLGSTVVLAWVIGDKVYVGWCGDSRAYRFNPQIGLQRLSNDHSLVQSWVDQGMITEEQAFNHPQSNVITRSLGDPNGVAQPETRKYMLKDGDVLLLCSDGLCGTLRDPEIERIMTAHPQDLEECMQALWSADEAAGWHDNVTTALAHYSVSAAPVCKVHFTMQNFVYCLLAISVVLNVVLVIMLQKAHTPEQQNDEPQVGRQIDPQGPQHGNMGDSVVEELAGNAGAVVAETPQTDNTIQNTEATEAFSDENQSQASSSEDSITSKEN